MNKWNSLMSLPVLLCSCLAAGSLAADAPYQDLIDAMNAGQGTGPCRIAGHLPQKGLVTLTCGKYTVRLNASSGFTIGEVRYRDALIATPAGAQGTVLLTEQAVTNMHNKTCVGDPWIGTAHGGEIVHEVTCTVDGKARPLTTNGVIAAERIVIEKTHTLYKFTGRATLVLTPDGYEEREDLRALQAMPDLHYLYLFMHPWMTSTKTWLAGYADGREESGEFGADRTITLSRQHGQPRWFALHDPTLKLGIVQFSRQPIPGGALIQVRPNYHKHYTNLSGLSVKAGDTVAYAMVVRVLEDETGDWSATRRAVAQLSAGSP